MTLKEPNENDFQNLKFFKKYLLFKRGSDEGTGKIFMWCYKNEEIGHAKYTCPYCGYMGDVSQEFKLPFKFNCKKCEKQLSMDRGKKFKK